MTTEERIAAAEAKAAEMGIDLPAWCEAHFDERDRELVANVLEAALRAACEAGGPAE